MLLLEKFPVLLLDMNGTFMFGGDRFGVNEDFHRTYRTVGGGALSESEVTRYIRSCFEGMSQDYENPVHYDDFPSLREGLRLYAHPPEAELANLARVFAMHELGSICEPAAALLRRLSQTHRLCLVANIWSPKQLWLEEFERAGINGAFSHKVFSSDFRSVKPSLTLYREALRGVGARTDEALFIGDDLRCDMQGAHDAGMATAWITTQTHWHRAVDFRMSNIAEIEKFEIAANPIPPTPWPIAGARDRINRSASL
jgi:putative hydrolase of the HAD superfamily